MPVLMQSNYFLLQFFSQLNFLIDHHVSFQYLKRDFPIFLRGYVENTSVAQFPQSN